MHNSLNERFFSFNSTVVIFRNLSGKRPESFKFWCLEWAMFGGTRVPLTIEMYNFLFFGGALRVPKSP